MARAQQRRPVAVVTGAGSGIGRAVTLALSDAGLPAVAVGRRAAPLQETAGLASGPVVPVAADIGAAAGRAAVAGALDETMQVRALVHGAGIGPVAGAATMTEAEWRQVMATNLDGRLFLTQALLPRLAAGSRILFVGSMSATRPRQGGAAYCVSMAGTFMLQACLRLELAERGIAVASAIPGPVHTPLLEAQMRADPAVFPDGAEFRALRAARRLVAPAAVGRFFRWLLTEVPAEHYGAEAWDIRDTEHHRHWLGASDLFAAP